MRAVAAFCALVLLTACAAPRVEVRTPQIDDLAVLPVRPSPPNSDSATQRDVAGFIIDLSAYADALEARIKSIMEAVNGAKDGTDRRGTDATAD